MIYFLYALIGVCIGVFGTLLALWLLADGMLMVIEEEDGSVDKLEFDFTIDEERLVKKKSMFFLVSHRKK